MINKVFLLLIVSLIFSSCSTYEKSVIISGDSFMQNGDQILSKIDSCELISHNPFYNLYNIKISMHYMIIDSIRFNTNNDSIPDLILILSPKIQEEHNTFSKCYNSKFNKRLLVCLVKKNSKYEIDCINENIILNNSEFSPYPYRKLSNESADVFSINYVLGNSTKCNYTYYFKRNNDSVYMYKSTYDCYLINLENSEQKTSLYDQKDSTSIKKINIKNYIFFPNLRDF